MYKKFVLCLVAIVFFSGFNFVYAEVIINEVQIAGTTADDEFIELYNSGESVEDLTGFYIKKKTSTGSESNFVVSSRFEGVTIPSGDYLLLARENKYTGAISPDVLWPSSYSLANNNSLTLYKGNETDKDEVSWETVAENKSVQKTSSNSWVVSTPTPKSLNAESNDNNDGNDDNDDENNEDNNEEDNSSSSSSDSSSSSKPKVEIKEQPIKVKIDVPKIAFVDLPLVFKTNATGRLGEPLVLGIYFWNFGDGSSIEIKEKDISHTYFYPGDYTVTLEYFESKRSKVPDVVTKLEIKVVPATVIISNVGDEKDFFIELSNNSNYDIDISQWKLFSQSKFFTFPRNTLLSSKKKIIFSSKITNFNINDKGSLRLFTSANEMAFDYNSLNTQIESITKTADANTTAVKISSTQPKSKLVKTEITETKESYNIPNQATINTPDLEDKTINPIYQTAGVVNSDLVADDKNNQFYLFFGGLIFLLIISSSAIYFLRRNRSVNQHSLGSDFDILDD